MAFLNSGLCVFAQDYPLPVGGDINAIIQSLNPDIPNRILIDSSTGWVHTGTPILPLDSQQNLTITTDTPGSNGILTIDNAALNINNTNLTLSSLDMLFAGDSFVNASGSTIHADNISAHDDNSNSGGAAFHLTNSTLNIDAQTGLVGFNQNHASNGSSGGAIYVSDTSSQVNLTASNFNVNFADNSADGNGGAISNNGSILITTVNGENDYNSNIASGLGGAIYNNGLLSITTGSGAVNFNNNYQNNNTSDRNGIYNTAAGTINMNATTGQIYINDGIAGEGTINKTGGGVLMFDINGINKNFTGTFNADAGTTVVRTEFFTGNNNIAQNATLDTQNSGDVTFNQGDTWNGTVLLKTDGKLLLDEFSNSQNSVFTQTGGDFTVQNNSNFYVSSATTFGGDTNLTSGSNMWLNANSSINGINNFNIDNGTVHAIDNTMTTYNTGGALIAGPGGANFTADINPDAQISDKYVFPGGISGTVNLVDFNMLNTPVKESFKVQIFEGPHEGATFTAPDKLFDTVIGKYKLTSYNDGWYGAVLNSLNPSVFRGQVATMGMYNAILSTTNVLLDHVYLDGQSMTAKNRMENLYASVPQFSPYQYKRCEGSIWLKNYTSIERLSMTNDLRVNNTLYGSLLMGDFPTVVLENGWEFLPTVYIGYNGARQSFDNVTAYQNGGQGGFMGTWMKDEFIGSILAYGGGYNNEMQVNGITDKTGNWFAGTAAKASYNFHPKKNIILQPNALVSYNIFGKQNWRSGLGSIAMNSGMLNGINVAPGLNLIYGGRDWTVYGTVSYTYNINDQISGKAGDINLPDVKMKHGWIEYGIGATKSWKESFIGYAQVTLRNAGRTGIGFQLGLAYKF